MSATPLPGLYIVATPIGNLGDISDRAKAILAAADVVACEDTRVTGKLLHLLGFNAPAPALGEAKTAPAPALGEAKTAPAQALGEVRKKPRLLRHDDHADDHARASLVERMADEVVVLACDAGTPLISDPGYRLVRDARAAGRLVTSVPGACAAITALTLAALPTDRFLFAGFLPAKAEARRKVIAELAIVPATLVWYESGPRLPAALLALANGLGERPAAVARELTKLHEECVTGTLSELAAHYATPPKGEIVIVVGPPAPVAVIATAADIDAALTDALATLPVARAARDVAKRFGIAREDAYARALTLAGKD